MAGNLGSQMRPRNKNCASTEKVKALIAKVESFMDEHVYPNERAYSDFVNDPANLWKEWPGMEALKEKARAQGLWNLFLPHEYGEFSPGLTNLEYAPLAEIMGRVPWSSQVFNCSAPDTGNMEVLAKFGSPEQQEKWLKPLLDGTIRSAYVMTEPQVASSDATNLELSITPDGDEYVLNGRKWWISNAMHPRCDIWIVMGKTDFNAPRHAQHSQILVEPKTPGITIVRHLTVFGSHNSPGGECELRFDNVRVPKENLILGEGRGFEIAQGRLGPGRIHHCMRSIGQAQRALEIMARARKAAWRSARSCPTSRASVRTSPRALRDRNVAPADAQGRRCDGPLWQQGRQGSDRRDQGGRPANGADRVRPGDSGPRRHGRFGRYAGRPVLHAQPLRAHRRRPGRSAYEPARQAEDQGI
jgi:alkylation response protein AidB-like acyl-CoA dehydrogenase